MNYTVKKTTAGYTVVESNYVGRRPKGGSMSDIKWMNIPTGNNWVANNQNSAQWLCNTLNEFGRIMSDSRITSVIGGAP